MNVLDSDDSVETPAGPSSEAVSPMPAPLVTSSDLPTAWKTAVSGALAVGVPEIAMVVAAAVMGREGFARLKSQFGRFLKKYGPPEQVGRTRYRTGLTMFTLPLLLAWLGPYLGHHVPGYGIPVRDLAELVGKELSKKPRFVGKEAENCLLSNAAKCFETFGFPLMKLEEMVSIIVPWVNADKKILHKPTKYQVRDGKF